MVAFRSLKGVAIPPSPKEWFGSPDFRPFSLRGNRQKTRKIFLTQLLTPQRLLTQSARKTKILLDLGRAI
jgi:hypothetical protein